MSREEFEGLPQIKFRLISMVFCHTKNQYIPKNKIIKEAVVATREVNLAWYAWQEQQKKIDEAIKHLDSVEGLVWYEEVKELLK